MKDQLNTLIKSIGGGAGLVAVGFFLCYFFIKVPGGCGAPQIDTVYTRGSDTLTFSPPETTMHPPVVQTVHARRDTADPEHAKRVDSLLAVVQNKDSLIRLLSTPMEAEHKFTLQTPDGIRLDGMVHLRATPLDGTFSFYIVPDTLIVPEHITEITKTVTIRETSPETIVAAAAIGMVVGVAIIELTR